MVSFMIERLETDAIRDEKDNHPLLHQKRRHRLTERCPQQVQAAEGESPSGTRGRIPCRHFLGGKYTNPSCDFRHPPVCLSYRSESGCKDGDQCRFRHVEVDGQPSKRSKKSGVKGSVAYARSLYNRVVCLKILIRESLFCGKLENWDRVTPSNSPRAHGTT